MLDFELGGYLLSALQVGVGNGYQLRFRDQAANIQSVLLTHRADPNYTHAQLRHNRPFIPGSAGILPAVAKASCPRRWGRDAPTTAARTAALPGLEQSALLLSYSRRFNRSVCCSSNLHRLRARFCFRSNPERSSLLRAGTRTSSKRQE